MNTTTARQTGTRVTLTAGDGAAWMLICETHDLCCEFDTKREARSFAAAPIEWCEGCGDEWAGREVVAR